MTTEQDALDPCCGNCAHYRKNDRGEWCGFRLPFWVHQAAMMIDPSGPSKVAASWGRGCPAHEPSAAMRAAIMRALKEKP